MEHLGKIAIKAFNEGSDRAPNERATGEILELTYSKMVNGWLMSIKLEEGMGGIGFYQLGDKLNVMSGHIVFSVDITPEIQKELDEAPISEI